MGNWPIEGYKASAADAMAREAEKIKSHLRAIISDANSHQLEMTKPGQPKPKPIEKSSDLRGLPEYARKYDKALREGQSRINAIAESAKSRARQGMTKPLPDEALKYLEAWDKYEPTVDELRGFMQAYGGYPQAAKIVNAAADKHGLGIRAQGLAEMQTEMIDSAAGLARSAANPDNATFTPSGRQLDEALTARITGEGPTEADFSGRLFGRRTPIADGDTYRIYSEGGTETGAHAEGE